MTFHVAFTDILVDQTWQRYNISLDEGAFAEARACLEAEATGPWSFRVMSDPQNNPTSLDTVYAFFFREMSDVVILQKLQTL
jgi:hypothetical protein